MDTLRGRGLARVSKNAVVLLAAQAGARLFNLALIAHLTRILGTAELGRYLLAMTAQAIALAVADLGLNTLTTREFSRDEGDAADGLWGVAVGLKLTAALGGAVVLSVAVAPLFGGERQILIALASLSLLPDAFNALATARVKAWQRMEISSGINLGVRLAYVVVGLLLLWVGFGVRALLVAYGATSLAGSLAFWAVLHRWRVPRVWPSRVRAWSSVLRASVPFAVTGMLTMLYTRLDLILLSYWQGDSAAGRYGMAYRLWEAMGILPASFLDALFPELSRTAVHPEAGGHFWSLYGRGRRVLWAIAMLLVVPGEAAAPLLLSFLYGRTPDVLLAVPILRLLLLALPFSYLYLLNGHVLYALGKQGRVTTVVALTALVNALGNAALIWRWGYWGAVGVKVASEVLLFALLQWIVRRSRWRSPALGQEGAL